ncbi:MAG: nucleotidyltransferase family protein [Candidatus Heimdallarchaeota archaeon]
MKLNEKLKNKRLDIHKIAEKYGAKNIRIFGSIARGEAESTSDIDILVDLEKGRSLLDLGGFQMALQHLMGRRVDVITEKGLRSRIREQVIKDAVPL